MRIRATISILAAMSQVAAAAAEERQVVHLDEKARQAIERYIQPTGTITSSWQAPGGLIGVAIEVVPGQGIVAYTDPGGEILLTGAAVRLEDQVNLANVDREHFFPAPGDQDMYEEALQLPLIASRQARTDAEPIIAVVDTQCGYCHQLAAQFAARGLRHRVRWVVVGWQGPKSRMQGAGLLEMAEDPGAEAGLWAILTGQHDGIPEKPGQAGSTALATTESWATRWSVEGTPTVLVPWRGQVHRIAGVPNAKLLDMLRDTH